WVAAWLVGIQLRSEWTGPPGSLGNHRSASPIVTPPREPPPPTPPPSGLPPPRPWHPWWCRCSRRGPGRTSPMAHRSLAEEHAVTEELFHTHPTLGEGPGLVGADVRHGAEGLHGGGPPGQRVLGDHLPRAESQSHRHDRGG